MAVSSVSFSKEGNVYVSDAIEVTGNALVLQIKFARSGGAVLERSIDGTSWVSADSPMVGQNDSTKIYETNVSGLVVGQKLRVRFYGGGIPQEINVLQ